MISDVLSDAVHNIRGYMSSMPENYNAVGPDLVALCDIMNQSRKWLDSPNPTGRLVNADFLRRMADQLDTNTV